MTLFRSARRIAAFVALLLPVIMGGCTVERSSSKNALALLQDAAEHEVPTDVGPLEPPPGLAGVFRADILLPPQFPFDSLTATARRLAEPAAPRTQEGVGQASTQETKAYVRGRVALRANDPRAALESLAFAHREGARPAARRALAEAFDALGQGGRATAIRLDLAARGFATTADLFRAGDGSLQRRAWNDALVAFALAIQRSSLAPSARLHASKGLATALEGLGRSAEAARVRWFALEAAVEACVPVDARVALERRVADDAAAALDFAAAIARWRSLVEGGLVDPSLLRGRIVFGLLAVGRSIEAQRELAQATLGEGDVSLLAWAREQGVDLTLLSDVFAERVAASPGDTLTIRLFAAVDPSRAVDALRHAASDSDDPGRQADIVKIAFAAGVEAAYQTACERGTTAFTHAAVVEALLHGPFSPTKLFTVVEGSPTDNPAVGAAVLRAIERPGAAWRLVEGVEQSQARIEAVLAAGAMGDPQRIDAVAKQPLRASVEVARVRAFRAAGEMERARVVAEAAVAAFPEDGAVFVARGRLRLASEATVCDGALDLEVAIRLGETTVGVWLDAMRAARLCGEPEIMASLRALRHTVGASAAVADLFRAYESVRSGRVSEAEETLRMLATVPGLEDEVVRGLIQLWIEGGREDLGRRWLSRRHHDQPARKVWAEGLLRLDVADGDVDVVLETLRAHARTEDAGFADGFLSQVLGNVERVDEDLALARRRIARFPEGPAHDLAIAALLVRDDPIEAKNRLFRLNGADLTKQQRSRSLQVAIRLPEHMRAETVEHVAAWFSSRGVSVASRDAAAIVRGLGDARGAALLEHAVPDSSERAQAWLGHAIVLARAKDYEAAAALLRFILERSASDVEGRALAVRPFVGFALRSGWADDDVIATLERIEQNNVDLAQAFQLEDDAGGSWRLAAAGLASTLGFERASIAFLEDALRVGDGDPSIRNNLGFSLLESDIDRGRAMELIEEAFENDPTSTAELDSVGWLRYKAGRHDPSDPEGALQAIAESVRLRRLRGERPSAEVLLHLGDASWRAGNVVEAERAWAAIMDAKGGAGVAQQYQELYEGWLRETFGALIVDPHDVWARLDGQWLQAASLRVQALAENGDPPVEPTWAELDASE